MKLRSISAVGLKGPDFSHQLSDATAIIGPNAAGKTRILQAIRLALGGWLPECGKTPRATWELASGPELEVRVEFETGQLSRKFWLDGSTVKTMSSGVEDPAKPLPDFSDLPLLNAEAYFEMTDSQRTVYVFERIKLPDSYNALSIISECKRLNFGDEHSNGVERALAFVTDSVRKFFSPGGSVQEGLGNAIEELRTSFTYWNSRQKATQGAVTTLAELKLRETEVVAVAQGVDKDIESAQADLDQLNTETGKLQAQQQEAERTDGRKKEIRKQLNADQIDYPRMIKKLHDEIEAIRPSPELDPKARENLVEAIRDSSETRGRVNAGVKQAREQIAKIESQLEKMGEMECCPFCKASQEGWQANVRRELKTHVAKHKEHVDEGVNLVKGLDKSLEKMEATLFESDESSRKNSQSRLTIESKSAEINRHERDQATETTRREQLEAELDGLNVLPEGGNLTLSISALDQKREAKQAVLTILKASKDAETRLQQQLVSAAQAELEHQDAKAHVLVIKAIAKLLKEKREAMIEEAFGGLLKIANQMTKGLLKTPLALHENTIGRWRGIKFITHRTMSGVEKKLTYVAIAIALSSQAPLRLALIDELALGTPKVQLKVQTILKEAIANGLIDQAVIVIPSDEPMELPGWGVIWIPESEDEES